MHNLKTITQGLTTLINVKPSGQYMVIEAWNKHCKIRVAEENNRILYRLLKTNFRLYLKTFRTLLSVLIRSQKKRE